MNKKSYIRMTQWFESHKNARKVMAFIYKYLPYVFWISYPALLIIKGFISIDRDFVTMLVVPPSVFFGVTIMRKLINRPRPYEKYSTPSVIYKERKGCSFPSRHAASAFVIAMCGYAVSLPLGIVLTVLASLVALTRILAGVHFISDVVFAAVFSVALASLFFFII